MVSIHHICTKGVFQPAFSNLSSQSLEHRLHTYYPSSCSLNLAYEQVYEENKFKLKGLLNYLCT